MSSAQVTDSGAGQTFRLRLQATPSSLAIFRDGLRGWLQDLALHPAEIFDVVLACSESLTLVIEERPRQVALVVEMTGVFADDRLEVTTRDYGLWHESHALDQEEPLSLSLMRALMDSVDLERHPDGQTIRLVRRLGRPTQDRRASMV